MLPCLWVVAPVARGRHSANCPIPLRLSRHREKEKVFRRSLSRVVDFSSACGFTSAAFGIKLVISGLRTVLVKHLPANPRDRLGTAGLQLVTLSLSPCLQPVDRAVRAVLLHELVGDGHNTAVPLARLAHSHTSLSAPVNTRARHSMRTRPRASGL